MNVVPTGNEQAPVQPAQPTLSHAPSDSPYEADVALTFDTAHIRAKPTTSVLENILRGEFVAYREKDETGR